MGKKNKTSKEKCNLNINIPSGVTKEEMIDIISQSIVLANKIEKENEIKQQQEIQTKFQNSIGYQANPKKGIIGSIKHYFNKIGSLIRLLFIKRAKLEGDRVITMLSSSISELFFKLFFVICWGLAVFSIIIGVASICTSNYNLWLNCMHIFIGVPLVVLGQIFRLAAIEASKLKDKNYLLAILANILAIVAIIVSIITLIISIIK